MHIDVKVPTLPIRDLSHFLTEVENLFDNIIEHWSPILFPEKFRQLLSNAWTELKQSDVIQVARDHLSFAQTKLSEAGLSGEQLKLKLAALSDAWETFKQKGTVKFLSYLLGWINQIMGSLVAVFPSLEAVKELKEAIEKFMEPIEL